MLGWIYYINLENTPEDCVPWKDSEDTLFAKSITKKFRVGLCRSELMGGEEAIDVGSLLPTGC